MKNRHKNRLLTKNDKPCNGKCYLQERHINFGIMEAFAEGLRRLEFNKRPASGVCVVLPRPSAYLDQTISSIAHSKFKEE